MTLPRSCFPALLACVGVAFLIGPASAGTRRHDRQDAEYLALSQQLQYRSVGQITAEVGGEPVMGSAVLITNVWVLTAAHVVDDPSYENMVFVVNDVEYPVVEFLPHESWTGDLETGWDIGLARLQNPLATITPAKRYRGDAELGKVGVIVGYGRTGDGQTGDTFDAGTRRAGKNVIDVLGTELGYSDRILMADFDNPHKQADSSWGSPFPDYLEYCAAPGDSGGGLFIQDGFYTKLVGIASFIETGPVGDPDGIVDSDYGDLVGWTRVSSFNDWIDSHIPNHWNTFVGVAAFGAPDNWTSSVPPGPTQLAVFDMSGARTVTFADDFETRCVEVLRGDFTFQLGGHTYTLNGAPSLVVSGSSGMVAKLTISGGTLVTTETFIGGETISDGTLTVAAGGAWHNSGSVYVGGTAAGVAGKGTLAIPSGASVQIDDTLKVWRHGIGGNVSINGALTASTLDVGGLNALVVLGAGATLDTTTTVIGGAVGTTGVVTTSGDAAWTNTGSVYVGGNETAAGGDGRFVLGAGTTLNVDGTLKIWKTPASGNVVIDGDAAVGGLDFVSGAIDGAGTLTVTGTSSEWSGGTMQGTAAGKTAVAEGARLEIAEGGSKVLRGRTLENRGTLFCNDGAALTAEAGATIENLAGATFEFHNHGRLLSSDASLVFNNAGTVLKSGDDGISIIEGTFNNTGTVRAVEELLALNGTLVQQSGTTLTGGTWVVDSPAMLVLPDGEFLTNQGTIVLNGPGAMFPQITPLADNQGAIRVFDGGHFETLDDFSNTGEVTVGAGSTFTVTGALAQLAGNALTGGTWNVYDLGTLVVGDTILTNQATVLLSGPAPSFARFDALADNQGSLSIVDGRDFTTAGDFSNTGTLTVGEDSTFRVAGALAQNAGGTLTGGTWNLDGGRIELLVGADITVNQADVTLSGAAASLPRLGTLADNQGQWSLLGGAEFTTAGDLANSGALAVGAGSTLAVTGNYTQTAGSTMVEGALRVLGGTATFSGGTLTLLADTGAGGSPFALNLSGATADFAATQHLAALSLDAAGAQLAPGGDKLVVTGLLTIDPADAFLELADNDLVVDYADGDPSPAADVQAWLGSGQNNGPNGYWDGPGIRSSAAANDPTGLSTLGALDNAEYGWPDLGGVPVDGSAVLVTLTYYGDADLDGAPTGDDYFLWLAGFDAARQALAHGGEPTLSGWLYGDFDYSGDVTGDDYFLWLVAFDAARAGTLSSAPAAAVPEPATLSLAAVGLAAVLIRCRGRRAWRHMGRRSGVPQGS